MSPEALSLQDTDISAPDLDIERQESGMGWNSDLKKSVLQSPSSRISVAEGHIQYFSIRFGHLEALYQRSEHIRMLLRSPSLILMKFL
jgi:hypothetical protein